MAVWPLRTGRTVRKYQSILERASDQECPHHRTKPEIVSVTVSMFRGFAPSGRLLTDLGPMRVLADQDKLQQIVLNLLSNAVKFTDPGGRITIRYFVDPQSAGTVRVQVADTGRGIAPEHLARVFEPFVQVNMRLTRIHGGTGLGLAISRNFARAMGGDLTVESEEGRGSTFSLSLPRIN